MRLKAIAEYDSTATATATVDDARDTATVDADTSEAPRPEASSFHDAATILNPNILMDEGTRPQSIIYTGRLYVDPDQTGRTHASFYLLGGDKHLQADLGRFMRSDPQSDTKTWRQEWRALYSRFLFGRMAWYEQRQVIAFWGQGSGDGYRDIKGPEHLMRPCLYALYSDNHIDDDTTVVGGDGSVGKVGDLIMGHAPTTRPSPAAAAQLELAKRMHLARGDEKKEIMKKLGVGGGGSGKSDKWDDALRRLPQGQGGLAPGQNKWRSTSESFPDRINRALMGL